MERVATKEQAWQLCEEYQCEITFRNEFYNTPKHVVVSLNAWTKIIGKDIIEAVNRLVDVYHTAPVDHEKLEWWKEHEEFYLPPSRKTIVK